MLGPYQCNFFKGRDVCFGIQTACKPSNFLGSMPQDPPPSTPNELRAIQQARGGGSLGVERPPTLWTS